MTDTGRISIGKSDVSGFLTNVPLTIIPLIIINTVGAEENGYFYIAYTIAGLLLMIPNAVSTSLFVEGSHNLPLKENVIKLVKFTIVLLIPAVLFMLIFGNQILLLFDKEYSDKSFQLLQYFTIS